MKRTVKTTVATYAVLILGGGLSLALPERVGVPTAPSSRNLVPILPPEAALLRPDVVREQNESRGMTAPRPVPLPPRSAAVRAAADAEPA